MPNDTSNLVLIDDSEVEEYLGIALYAQTGGFSKGTANVSAHDVQKLKGLLQYYEKKPHPFTACVRDNRKRFGAETEKYCAVLKDLIVGNTKWRKGGHKTAKGAKLSEEALVELFSLDVPEDFFDYIANATFDEGGSVEFATGDVAWDPTSSWNTIRQKITAALNAGGDDGSMIADSPYDGGISYWVDDVSGNEALVCAGQDHYVVPFTVDKAGEVTLSDETDWKPVNQAWVESEAMFSDQIGAEMFFDAGDAEAPTVDANGYIWKTILREGKWAMSPGPGQKPMAKPITVVKDGPSDPAKLIISMDELKRNFEDGAVENVTIPTSHADKVHENTGFVKSLRFGKDKNGREILEGAHHFTEPDIKDKAMRGTIANTSAGILFDYVSKENGKKYNAVLGHNALTNHPWLTDLNTFGTMASENLKVLGFAEEQPEVNEPVETTVGGDVMEDTQEVTTPKFLSDLGLSETEAASRLARYEELERRDREHAIDSKVAGWEADNKAPALVVAAKAMLSAASTTDTVLNLSEDGKTVGLTAVDVIDRLMAAAPALTLAEDKVDESKVQGDAPEADAKTENDKANFSQEEKTLMAQLYLEGYNQDDAVAEAQKRLGKSA